MTKVFLCLLVLIGFASGCTQPGSLNSASLQPDSCVLNTSAVKVYQKCVLITGYNVVDTVQHPDDRLFAYGLDVSLPELQCPEVPADELNKAIRGDFSGLLTGNKEAKSDSEHFRKISFRYYVSDSLISIVIEDLNAYHLSEATSEFKVYHYDMKNGRLLRTNDMLQIWGMSQLPLLQAVAEQITMPPDHSDPLFQSEWFDTVKWKDINQLKLYKNNARQIVIIYPLAENGIEAEQIIQ